MNVLLDTCVLTELGKDDGNLSVKSAVAELDAANLYLSVLSVGEIAKGIALLAVGRKMTGLGTWLARVESHPSPTNKASPSLGLTDCSLRPHCGTAFTS